MNLTRVVICVILYGAGNLYSQGTSGYNFQKKRLSPDLYALFLDYTPLCGFRGHSQDVFSQPGIFYSAAGGTLVAVILGYRGKSLVVVAVAAIISVYLLELAGGVLAAEWLTAFVVY